MMTPQQQQGVLERLQSSPQCKRRRGSHGVTTSFDANGSIRGRIGATTGISTEPQTVRAAQHARRGPIGAGAP